MKRLIPFISMGLILGIVSACSSEKGFDYRNIEPVHQVRNAPVPVPWPRYKPAVRSASSATPLTTQSTTVALSSNGAKLTVRSGDTLYSLARRAGIEVDALVAANSLRAPYVIRPGQELRLPNNSVHTVKSGDTGYSISRLYGVDLRSLARLNNLRAPYTLTIGQELKIPSSGNAAVGTRAMSASSGSTRGASTDLPPRQGADFDWPVEGRIAQAFGPLGQGLHNDGINISGRRGQEVKAAEAGIVAYAGNGIRGFGNLLLIRHQGGWVTAYAHNERLFVERGDRVARGQRIASVGTSGGLREPQLHFEVRKGTVAVDPVRYLARR